MLYYTESCQWPETIAEEGNNLWRVRNMTLATVALEHDAGVAHLRLNVDVWLGGKAAETQLKLRVALASKPWEEGAASSDPEQPLEYRVESLQPVATSAAGEGRWQQYLTPGSSPAPADLARAPADTLRQELLLVLERWLAHNLVVNTVAGARRCALSGSVGQHGPLQRKVLERSGQADLEVDVTAFGEVSDASERGGSPGTILALYGERHGRWLLHRRVAQPQKVRRNEPELPQQFSCTVLIASDIDALIKLAGLNPLEKRLFQSAGFLPHATLPEPAAAEPSPADTPQTIDVSKVADRARAYLQAIAALAQTGKLNVGDMDLLLKLARHLVKAVR